MWLARVPAGPMLKLRFRIEVPFRFAARCQQHVFPSERGTSGDRVGVEHGRDGCVEIERDYHGRHLSGARVQLVI